MIGGIVLDTDFGEVVGFENHSGATLPGPGQAPFGRVLVGHGNNGSDATRALARTMSSAPTCTDRSFRPTHGWPTVIAAAVEPRPAGPSNRAC